MDPGAEDEPVVVIGRNISHQIRSYIQLCNAKAMKLTGCRQPRTTSFRFQFASKIFTANIV